MGVFGGPEIPNDGLVLALDAGNPRNFNLTAVEVLVVAGGGGGGGSYGAAGGGGAGGLVYHSSKQVTPGTQLTVTIGVGGQGGRYYSGSTSGNYGASNNSHGFQGGNSSFDDIVAIGGGGGNEAFYTDSIYKNGGSGGGAGDYYFGIANPGASRGGLATQTDSGGGIGYGFPGGSRGPGGPTTAEDNSHAIPHEGSGGGGAGGTATGGGPSQPSNGGIGRYYPQFIGAGSPEGWFAGGGGGGYYYYGPYTSTNAPNTDTGWKGGGGRGCNGNTNYDAQDGGTYARGRGTTAGTPNTGGGGGGGSGNNTTPNAPDGGSGIVIVRYPGPQKAIGGVVTSVGGDTIHTFTTSGNFTPLVATNGSAVLGLSDLSGNRNFGTTANSPTYSSANGGSLSFDGSDDYVSISSGISYSEYTFMFFCKWISSVGNNERIFGSDAFGTYTIFNPSNVGFHYNPLGGSPPSVILSSGVNIGFGTWCQVAVTVSASNTLVKIYVNGVLGNSSSALPSQNLVGNLFIGAQNTSHKSNCNVSNFNLYNRALSAAEISQNFNALRGRYGI